MIDFIVRDCGRGEFLPMVIVSPHCGSALQGKVLYRGERMKDANQAFFKARDTWLNNGTGDIAAFKKENLL